MSILALAGAWPATRHRVVVPEEELRRKTHRQSIAFFVQPDDQVLCEPLTGNYADGLCAIRSWTMLSDFTNLSQGVMECSFMINIINVFLFKGPDPRYPPITSRQHLENRYAATYGDGIF